MASGDSSNPPTGSASNMNSAPMPPTSPPKYVPQFSATTEMILKRINSGASSSLSSIGITGMPPGYEDMRRSVLQGMKTSANMEIPATPPTNNRRASAKASGGGSARATPTPGSGKGKGKATPKSRAGTKRKRVKVDESMSEEESDEDDNMSKVGSGSDSDSSEEVVMLPKITQSGRQIVKPTQFVPQAYEREPKRRAPSKKLQEQALCKRCRRGHSPNNNMIVFCDGCNGGWHQQCHDPHVSDEAIKDEDAPWFCLDCSRERGLSNKTIPQSISAPPPPDTSGEVSVAPSSPKGVSWAGKSTEEKRVYLHSLPHQRLVSLLLQATTIHPSLPIFPATSTTNSTNSNNRLYNSTAGLFTRAEADPTKPMNFIRKVQPNPHPQSTYAHQQSLPHQPVHQPNNLAHSHPPHPSTSTPTPNQDLNSDDSAPNSPPYPIAGKGMMSKLGPDEADLEWLEDSVSVSAGEAFQHLLFDGAENGNGTTEGRLVNGVGSGSKVGPGVDI